MKTTTLFVHFSISVVSFGFAATAGLADGQSPAAAAVSNQQRSVTTAQTVSSPVPTTGNTAQSSERRLSLLDALVQLSADQKTSIARIFATEAAAIAALLPEDHGAKEFEIRQTTRGQVRALLTPAQVRIYDTTPQFRGGGRTVPLPENRVAALDRQVGLTSAQRELALQIYAEEADALMSIAPEDRMQAGAVYRQASQHQIYDLLTVEQRDKLETQRRTEAADQIAINRFIKNAVSTSHTVTGRIGGIAAVNIQESSQQEDAVTHVRKGNAHCEVIGEKGSEKVVVY